MKKGKTWLRLRGRRIITFPDPSTPGELKRLNDVLAFHDLNIAAQHLETDSEIGYVVVDVTGKVSNADAILAEIRDLEGTIRVRMLRQTA